jgi:hypothetical protein
MHTLQARNVRKEEHETYEQNEETSKTPKQDRKSQNNKTRESCLLGISHFFNVIFSQLHVFTGNYPIDDVVRTEMNAKTNVDLKTINRNQFL